MRLLVCVIIVVLTGCASRAPIPPGTVPQQTVLSAADEQYGHDVLSALTEQFPLDTDDQRINRVRDIADRLAMASGNDQTPWHVHVLEDDSVKNAAATRGNYLFVWTGMFNTIRDDTELATIIAHEMGHVLAQHTAENPQQEAAQILSGIFGIAAGGAVASQGYGGPLSDLTQMLIENIFKAALVNPGSQSDELEADHIGLFLMSDAAYNPEEALAFWERVQTDPDFQTGTLQFFSSHPSTEQRVQELRKYIDAARERYQLARGQIPKNSNTSFAKNVPEPKTEQKTKKSVAPTSTKAPEPGREESWIVAVANADIHASPEESSPINGTLTEGTVVTGTLVKRRWFSLKPPLTGYIRSANLSPQK